GRIVAGDSGLPAASRRTPTQGVSQSLITRPARLPPDVARAIASQRVRASGVAERSARPVHRTAVDVVDPRQVPPAAINARAGHRTRPVPAAIHPALVARAVIRRT